MREAPKYLIGLVVAGVALWWVLRGTDPGLVLRQLLDASPAAIFLCIALNLGHNLFRVWRWRALLGPIRSGIPLRPMFAAVMIGYMTTWIVPGRLGELVRPLLLSAREGVPLGPCVGTVVADRLLDATAVVLLFAFGSWWTPLEGQAADYAILIRTGSIAMAIAVVVGVGLMLALSSASERLHGWLGRRSNPIRWLGRTILSVAGGIDALRSVRVLLVVLAHSLLAWLAICGATWYGIRAVGAQIPFGAVMVIMPIIVLGVAVPTPGGAGPYHGAIKLGLMLFGVSELLAVSAGFLLHVLITVPVILAGMVFLWVERISLRELVASASAIRRLGSLPEGPAVSRALESAP